MAKSYQLTHLGWVVATAISRMGNEGELNKIPGWAAYNSLLSTSQPVTQVGALPLLPEVAHNWSTLLTVMMQARKLKELAVGDDHPTIISFDLALYEKVVQLLDSSPDLQVQFVPRIGELHVVMASLRALGTSIENSGIDDAWIEPDVYGSATTRQILQCKHYIKCYICIYVGTKRALVMFALQNLSRCCRTIHISFNPSIIYTGVSMEVPSALH